MDKSYAENEAGPNLSIVNAPILRCAFGEMLLFSSSTEPMYQRELSAHYCLTHVQAVETDPHDASTFVHLSKHLKEFPPTSILHPWEGLLAW